MTIELREVSTAQKQDRAASCRDCAAPLADDQRYCLNCGARTGAGRLAPSGSPPTSLGATEVEAGRRALGWAEVPLTAGAAAAALGLLLLVLIAGLLIGRAGDNAPAPVAAAAPKPQVIKLEGVGSGAAGPAAAQTFTSDWPDGKRGFTVQLETLANDSPVADVEAAKADATRKGAADVGALNSDDYPSLDGGNYVVYSGVFDRRGEAARALGKLKAKFPAASVVKVDAGGGGSGPGKQKTVKKNQLKNLDKLSPQDYQKKSRKLPDKLKLPGKAPPKDNKKPGGGGGSETIG